MSKIADKKKTYYLETTFKGQKELLKLVSSCMKADATVGIYLECQLSKNYNDDPYYFRYESFNITTYKITWDLKEKKSC